MGVSLEEGKRIGIGIAAANRDPAKFPDPDRFDIHRRPIGHFGFGTGIHATRGQITARWARFLVSQGEAEAARALFTEVLAQDYERHLAHSALTDWSAVRGFRDVRMAPTCNEWKRVCCLQAATAHAHGPSLKRR